MKNELTHWGVKGQKWGRRRYQNPDGSLTAAGRERYGTKESFDKQYDENIKRNLKATKGLVDSSKNLTEQTQRIYDDKKSKKTKKMKAKAEQEIRDHVYKMTDKELRDAVNRMNMEERYTQVMRDRTAINVGESKAAKFMDKTVDTLTVASITLSVALMIKELKK